MMTVFRIILFFMLMNACSWADAASISMTVDRNPVAINESFRILFESSESVDGEPDFSPLEKDFTILNTGRSSNTSIINGKMIHANQWTLTVMAKKIGILNIPLIRFGKDKSPPGTVEITASASMSTQHRGDIFLEVEATPDDPYVQAQVLYTVRLYRSVSISNASLSEPQLSGGDAVIEKLGDDRSYEVNKVGIRYVVIERRYALFPQGSGDITIEPVTFQGQIGRDAGFFIDPFGPPPRVVVEKSKALVLHVKPVPKSFTGKHWLPLYKLDIQEQWSVDPFSLPEGEPVTRTLKLIANGLTASQLPDINDEIPDSIKQYPDQPLQDNSLDRKGITGTREQKIAIIPSQAGKYQLPAIEIQWWNTDTDRQQVAVLPERTITVLSSGIARQIPPAKTTGPVDVPANDEQTAEKISPVTGPVAGNDHWKWISIALATGWLLTLLLWWKFGLRRHAGPELSGNQETARHILNELKQACQRNDPVATKNHVLKWAALTWPVSPPVSLGQVEKKCTGNFSEQLRILNQCLYSSSQQDWNGHDFFDAFTRFKKEAGRTTKEDTGDLEPLYKL